MAEFADAEPEPGRVRALRVVVPTRGAYVPDEGYPAAFLQPPTAETLRVRSRPEVPGLAGWLAVGDPAWMDVLNLGQAVPFIIKDGSEIRELLAHRN